MNTRTAPANGTSDKTATAKTTTTTTATEQPAMTTSKITDAAHRAVDNVAAHLSEAERKLRDQAVDKEAAIRDAAGTASDKASEIQTKTRDYIQENPMAAAGIAFAAGILFSAWMRK